MVFFIIKAWQLMSLIIYFHIAPI